MEGLKHNMLSVSQMCDNGYDVTFQSKDWQICNMKDGKMAGKEIKTHMCLMIQGQLLFKKNE